MDSEMIKKWEETIRTTIYSTKYIGCEINGNLQVAVSYAKIWKRDVYLFGTEMNMDCFTKFFLHEGVHIRGIIDRLEESVGKKLFGIPIISLHNLDSHVSVPQNTVIFCFSQMKKEELSFFKSVVEKVMIKQVFYFDSILRAIITTNSVEEWDRNRIIYYQKKLRKSSIYFHIMKMKSHIRS